jgi:hypothetical protein
VRKVATAGHETVPAKRVQWRSEAGDVEGIPDEDDLSIEEEFGDSSAHHWKSRFVA